MSHEAPVAAAAGLPPEALRSLPDLLRFAERAGALDLALGIPPFDPPEPAIDGAVEAMRTGHNQYADSRGLAELRGAFAEMCAAEWGCAPEPDRELTVTCGVAGGVFCALMALLRPGDEVIVFEPAFAHHVQTARLLGARVVPVPLRAPDWALDPGQLAAAFGPRTRCVLLANPANPTGRVFDHAALTAIAAHCAQWGAALLVDEIYADLDYTDHMAPAWSLRDTVEDLVVLRGVSKVYSASGWRVGFALAPAPLTDRLRAVHDASTLGAPTPLQLGVAHALRARVASAPLRAHYQTARDRLAAAFTSIGTRPTRCEGGIFLCVDVAHLAADDLAAVERLLIHAGVLVAPGRMFFADPAEGRRFIRVCFARRARDIDDAITRLAALGS